MMGLKEARDLFKVLIDKRDQADKLTLELMRNPEVRGVQDRLMDVCDIKLNIHERLCDAVTMLRKKYPDGDKTLFHPWHRAEYNMYERHEETNKC
jgi:hypothetical protein